ncbi:MAG: sulfatase-like hydrolase/transferase [Lachnospiraceae bacterium]|nr:sulfatase-like hydrolase/transferase [Lachnospiraceae bacterium]
MGIGMEANDKLRQCVKDLVPALLLSLLYAFTLCVYAPLDLFVSNRDEFWFDIYEFFPPVFIMFLAVFIAAFLFNAAVYFLCRNRIKKLFEWLILIEAAAFLCIYIEGNFIVGALPPIDGNDVDWKTSGVFRDTIVTAAVWLVVFLTAVFCFLKFHYKAVTSAIKFLCPCFFLLMTSTLVIESMGKWESIFYSRINDNHDITTRNIFQYSKNENFIIVLLDAYDCVWFQEIMAEDPEYYEGIFEDFTFYQDAMGQYPRTAYSIPLLFTGAEYENQERLKTFSLREFSNSSWLKELEERGYKLGMYSKDYQYLNKEAFERLDNLEKHASYIGSRRAFDILWLKLVGFRYLPYGLKQYCQIGLDAFRDLRARPEGAGTEDYSWKNYFFYDLLLNSEFDIIDQNCFRFIHLKGGHTEFDMDENVVYTGKTKDWRPTYKGCMKLVDTYLKKLKESGVWDNSVVVVMSDHGNFLQDGYGPHPILFIKGRNEHHPMYRSDEKVAYKEMINVWPELLDGAAGDHLTEIENNQDIVRRYLFYWVEKEPLEEYEQAGKASDIDTLLPTGRVFEYHE